MIEQLFGSKTRVKLLKLFYSNPNRSFYVREITRKIDEQINSVRRELSNLLSIGIISSSTNNNRLYYEVSQDYEYYDALSAIFGGAPLAAAPAKNKKDDVQDQEVENVTGHESLKSTGNVTLAVLTGQFTRDDRAGVDLVIVGDVNPTKVSHYVDDLEKQESIEVRYVLMTLEEYNYRRQINDRFLSQLLASKMQVLIDKNYLINPKPEPKKKAKDKE